MMEVPMAQQSVPPREPEPGHKARGTAHATHEGPVGVIRLERPARANAYDAAMLDAIEAGLDGLLAGGDVVVLVVEAEGDGAFCGGADLDVLPSKGGPGTQRRASPEEALDLASQRIFDRIARAPVVSIAAVHGAAVGGGFELALACDLRVVGPKARFHLPETALGFIPSAGGCSRLSRLVGPARAKEVVLGGRDLDAATAVDWGLAALIATDPRAEARAWAGRIARRDPVAIRLAKLVIDRDDLSVGLSMERLAEAVLYARKQTTGS
jgi:enoyl-CoA hydratase